MATLTDETVSKYWNWLHSMKKHKFPPGQGECLIDNSDPSVVFLMDPADVSSTVGPVNLDCTQTHITSKQPILVPLWVAWGDRHEFPNQPNLAKCARDVYNLGNIKSQVKVDGDPVANLDVTMSKVGNTVTESYASNGQQNVTKHTSANDFELTIPPDSVKLSCPGFPVKEGKKSAGSDGWWALVTLDSGPHKISYNTIVSTKDLPPGSETSPGTPFTSAVITYSVKVA